MSDGVLGVGWDEDFLSFSNVLFLHHALWPLTRMTRGPLVFGEYRVENIHEIYGFWEN